MANTARLTVDMTPEDHSHLKAACAHLGVSMREFMLRAAFIQIEELEDFWLSDKANETLHRLETGTSNPNPASTDCSTNLRRGTGRRLIH